LANIIDVAFNKTRSQMKECMLQSARLLDVMRKRRKNYRIVRVPRKIRSMSLYYVTNLITIFAGGD